MRDKEEEDDNESDEGFELGQAIVNSNLSPKTVELYDRCVNKFVEWIHQRHPSLITANSSGKMDVNMEAVSCDVMQAFFSFICKKRNSAGVELEPAQLQSISHVVGNYSNAMKYYYDKMKVEYPTTVMEMIKRFRGDDQRTVAGKKQVGEMKMSEGKSPLNFAAYKYLAMLSISGQCGSDFKLSTFAHLFLVLCWNLIGSCTSVASLMFEHITLAADNIEYRFAMHKGDQKEGKSCFPKSTFANLESPEICPTLALAIYVFTIGFKRTEAKATLFGGGTDSKDVETKFSRWLKVVSEKKKVELCNLGMDNVENIGTHSFHKGAASFLSNVVGGPSARSICLRAGWSIGRVQQGYIFQGEGEGDGDQICGRVVAGLDVTKPQFAELPPHFKNPQSILSKEQWCQLVDGYDTYYPDNFKDIFPMLLARLFHSRQWLTEHLPGNHPLFVSKVWLSNIDFIRVLRDHPRDVILCGCGRNPISGLTATGIPPHLIITAGEVPDHNDKMTTMITNTHEDLQLSVFKVPDAVTDKMFSTVSNIHDALPVTTVQLAELEARLTSKLNDALLQSTAIAQKSLTPANNNNSNNNNSFDPIAFNWGGKFHPVPEGFQFPKDGISVKTIWDLWFSGKPPERIAPFRRIKCGDLTKVGKSYLSKAKLVISSVVHLQQQQLPSGNNKNSGMLTEEQIENLPITQRDLLFEEGFLKLLQDLYPQKSLDELDIARVDEMHYTTLYEHIRKKRRTA